MKTLVDTIHIKRWFDVLNSYIVNNVFIMEYSSYD